MDTFVTVLVTVLVIIALKFVVLLIAGKGSLARVGVATNALFAVMGDAGVAAKVQPLLVPTPPEPDRKSVV